jgi:hypothetical protein
VECTKILSEFGASIFKEEEMPELGDNKFIRELSSLYQATWRYNPE